MTYKKGKKRKINSNTCLILSAITSEKRGNLLNYDSANCQKKRAKSISSARKNAVGVIDIMIIAILISLQEGKGQGEYKNEKRNFFWKNKKRKLR